MTSNILGMLFSCCAKHSCPSRLVQKQDTLKENRCECISENTSTRGHVGLSYPGSREREGNLAAAVSRGSPSPKTCSSHSWEESLGGGDLHVISSLSDWRSSSDSPKATEQNHPAPLHSSLSHIPVCVKAEHFLDLFSHTNLMLKLSTGKQPFPEQKIPFVCERASLDPSHNPIFSCHHTSRQ